MLEFRLSKICNFYKIIMHMYRSCWQTCLHVGRVWPLFTCRKSKCVVQMDLVLFLEAKTAALIGDHWHFFLKMKYFSSIKLWNSCQSKMHCFRTKREISLAPSFKLQHEHQILSDIQIMIRELSIAKGQYQQIILFKSTISISCLPRKNPSSNAEKKKNVKAISRKLTPPWPFTGVLLSLKPVPLSVCLHTIQYT